jgi:rubrerythrin
VDGIPLICTGGGGAMIEDVSEEIRASDVEHHMIHFYEENDELVYQICDLSEDCYSRERRDPILRENLTETVQHEMMAYLKYQMFADRAKRRGMDKIANLFTALASSEYHHARNFYSVLERPSAFAESVQHFLPGENFEHAHLYQMLGNYAAEHQAPLTRQAYAGAAQAEQVHEKLLLQAQDLEAFDREKIYVCPICGFVMAGDTVPERCPVCGGPSYQFEQYQVSDLRNGQTEMEK